MKELHSKEEANKFINYTIGLLQGNYDTDCTICYANESFIHLFGYSPKKGDTLSYGSLWDTIYEKELPLVKKSIFHQLQHGKTAEIKYHIHTKKNELIWVNNRIELKKDIDGTQCFYCIITKISDKINIHNLTNSIVEQIPESILITLLNKEITIIYANTECLNKMGYLTEEIVGKSLQNITPPVENSILIESIQKQNYRIHNQKFQCKNGEVIWVNLNGKQINMVGDESAILWTVTDITSFKNTELNLKMTEERYRFAAENNSDIIIDYNILDDSIYHVTKRVETLFGIPQYLNNAPQYLVNSGAIHTDSAKDFLALFEKIRSGKPQAECTIKTCTVSKKILWVTITLNTIYDNNQKPVRAIGIMKDISRQKEAELQYKNESLYRDAMIKDSIMYYEIDLTHHKVLTGHEKWIKLFHVPYTDDYTKVLEIIRDYIVHRKDKKVFMSTMSLNNILSQYHKGNQKIELEYRRYIKGSKPKWVLSTIHIIYDSQEDIIKAFCYIKDINEIKEKELELKQKAERDLLTGLYNKVTAEHLIQDFLSHNKSETDISAFMIIDLDNFKSVNDQMGHAFGDAVLSETAHKLQLMCRKNDIAGRIGGDEFVLFLKNLPNRTAIEYKSKKICQMFRSLFNNTLNDCKISGTIGISILPEHGVTFEELYRKSDMALYEAKRNGKDTYYIYNPEIQIDNNNKTKHASIDRSTEKTFAGNIIEYVFRIMYESKDIKLAIHAIFELICKHFNYSRGYIYELSKDSSCCRNTFEWTNPNFKSFKDNLKTIPTAKLYDYQKRFNTEGLYIVNSLRELEPDERMHLEHYGIHSRLQYALTANGKFQGFIGFDKSNSDHKPTASELSILHVVAQILDVFLSENNTLNQLNESNKMLQMVIDHLNTCTYVIDSESYSLLFVNQHTSKQIPDALPGTLCYEKIREKNEPCKDCPILELSKTKQQKCTMEQYHERTKSWNHVEAHAIKLPNGKDCFLINCYDITEYKNRKEITSLESFTQDTALYNALCHSTDDYIYMCDMPNNVFYFPQKMVDEFNLPGQIVINATPLWGSKIHEKERQAFFKAFDDILNGVTNVHNQEYRALNKNGNWVWLRCRGYLEHDKNGVPSLFAGIITNLGRKSKIDHLSGLPNKYEFENQIRSHIANKGKEGSILILGLDNFKYINNLYGREFGDKVIKVTAQQIQSLSPSNIQIYRLDGDEFGLYIPNSKEDEIIYIYEDIHNTFQRQQELEGKKYFCTISGGYTIFEGQNGTFDSFFKQAEYALEYSKSEGKNRLSRYNTEIMESKIRSLTITELLRESVENNFSNFELYYQPQINTENQNLEGAEALLRWSCNTYGKVSPVEFVPLLEQTGLIHAVGKWVLKEAAFVCSKWRTQKSNFIMSINLSYLQLLEKDFIPYINEILQLYHLEASALHVELTESCIASGSRSLTDAFQKIRALGIHIAMDDFGTGYSSLEILKNEPADVVKIDRVFVKDITHSNFDATFIQFVVALCHDVNIKVCLEGVETWEEYELVKPMHVDFIQGYLFGAPISEKEFEKKWI